MKLPKIWALCLSTLVAAKTIDLPGIGTVEIVQADAPSPPPSYMVDNVGNTHRAAPDKGTLNGPVVQSDFATGNSTASRHGSSNVMVAQNVDASSSYWLESVQHGQMPYAGDGYKFFRNVKDYGAKGDGTTDDTQAINDAIVDGQRCGQNCGSTTTKGALIYFPAGTYLVSSPIIQYYYSQFVGDPNNLPVIKGAATFSGIALIDTDVYIPGANGQEWYLNQNQFYRQIRNFVIDLTAMPNSNKQGDQQYVPTGIHWQVAQATSMQNVQFKMPQGGGTQAVGVFMENGSGGFLSDLNFFGGNIGIRAGSQQYTMRGVKFVSTATAISMIWDWGMTLKELEIYSAYVAIDTTTYGGSNNQGTGSLVVQDSTFNSVPYGITLRKGSVSSSLVLDNLQAINCQNIVMNSGVADPVLAGDSSSTVTVQSWALGFQYTDMSSNGTFTYGDISPAPSKPAGLISQDGKYFTRSKPQYENVGSVVNVLDNGVRNDGTGDQTVAINAVLANNVNSVIFFPAGIYLCQSTINIPVGARIVGEGWSQLVATGDRYSNPNSPYTFVKVGNSGDKGVVEMSDLLFTTRGSTPGAVMLEWNVHESGQGSAGMWDCHFRIGGSENSLLQLAQCPQGNTSPGCQGPSLLMHVTGQASGYFENVWVWTADHDLDNAGNADQQEDPNGVPNGGSTRISIFTGRGLLVESQGPTWFYGSSVEHSALYQYQFAGASNVYLGHAQTETPYYQPNPNALSPFAPSTVFRQDPQFEDCVSGTNSTCLDAWALRVVNSTNVFVYSAGFYSFFNSYSQDCVGSENCQQRLIDIGYSQGLWMYNVFTKGAQEVISPQGGIAPVMQADVQDQFTTEVAVYLGFALSGADIGGRNGADHNTGSGVGILPLPCTTVAASATFTMSAACTSGIGALPSTGPDASKQNSPPGPDTCHEICDFYRLLSGTCCGRGGSLGNPIAIPPSVTIPYDIPLAPGYTPNTNITIAVPGQYDPNVVYGTATAPSAPSTTYPSGYATGSPDDPQCTKKECGCIPAGTPIEVFPSGVPLPATITLPAGHCQSDSDSNGVPIVPVPLIIIPPLLPLPVDPPCFGTSCAPCIAGACFGESTNSNGEDLCENLSSQSGRCSNGNFPVWDPSTNQINCDIPDDQVDDYISACQEEADDNLDYTDGLVDCTKDQACETAGVTRRSLLGFDSYPSFLVNATVDKITPTKASLFARQQGPPSKRPRTCPAPPSNFPGSVQPGQSGVCDVTFNCDTSLWPNVCNNAAYAQDIRGKPSVLTYQGRDARDGYITRQWWRTHAKKGDTREHIPAINALRGAGQLPGQPNIGWGLIGCEVEEYPFGNSLQDPVPRGPWAQRSVLRLVPQEENRSHGNALGQFINSAIRNNGLSADGGWNYCVAITGGNIDRQNYLLSQDQSMNRCGQAHGPGYLLMNDISASEARSLGAGERRWDEWFDCYGQTFPHTVYSSGTVIATAALPSQYGFTPSPGMQTYVGRNGLGRGGHWTTAGVGVAAPSLTNLGPNGGNLKYDAPGSTHNGIFRRGDEDEDVVRNIDIDDLGYDPREAPFNLTLADAGLWKRDVPSVCPPGSPHAKKRGLQELSAPLASPGSRAVQASAASSTATTTALAEVSADFDDSRQLAEKLARVKKRQSLGGSFLDPNVYSKALGCPVPYEDPCLVGDCFEGGVVFDGSAGIAPSGSDQQDGDTPPNAGSPTTSAPPPEATYNCQDCNDLIDTIQNNYGDYICTDDSHVTLHGHTAVDPSTNEYYGDYYVVAQNGGCYLTLSKTAASFGFPDAFCAVKKDFITMLTNNQAICPNRSKGAGATYLYESNVLYEAKGDKLGGNGRICVAGSSSYARCGAEGFDPSSS